MPKVIVDKSYLTGVDYIINWNGYKKSCAEKTARFERLGKGRKTKKNNQTEEALEMDNN